MRTTVRFLVVFLTTFVFSIPAMAVDDIGLFEMDGNAATGDITGYEDWQTLYSGGPSESIIFTGIQHDHEGLSVFEGGRKDILDLDTWRWKAGTVPDKDDITHAYAAAYRCPEGQDDCTAGDMVIYFGADRYSNTGDAFLGFWFFKDHVTKKEDGSFNGVHQAGDALVLVNFPQATNAVPEIRVVAWEPACMKADKDPAPGQCVAKNLALVYDGVVCAEVVGYDNACATTNEDTIMSPWDYQAKTPATDCTDDFCMPYESFFEGGINLTALFGPTGSCFASFLAESRSSSEFTATLKDFVLEEFPLCAVEISKSCGTGTYDVASGKLKIPFSVTVENTGVAAVAEVLATEDLCGTGSAQHSFGPLASGASDTWNGWCELSPAGFSPPVVNGVSAVADSGEIPVFLADSCDAGTDPDSCYDTCGFNLSPAIEVHKACQVRLDDQTGSVLVKVLYTGSVENTSDEGSFPVPLSNVAVYDDNGTPGDETDDVALTLVDCTTDNPLTTPVWLEPGEEACFAGDYLPGSVNSDCPADAHFMDTVTATSKVAFSDADEGDVDTADCDLCTESCP